MALTRQIRSGLLSITFRQETVDSILDLAQQGKMTGIEWGSDVHIKPGDFLTAERVRQESKARGLEVLSYASYYRAGVSQPEEFAAVLESAKALGADRIRVWAGDQNAELCSSEKIKTVTDDLLRISALAKPHGIRIGIEYHIHTLTNRAESTFELMKSLQDSNIFSYWQPPVLSDVEKNLRDIEMLGKWIQMIHVYHWSGDYEVLLRHPLQEGEKIWEQYFQAIAHFTPADAASLEFVKEDAVASFLEDAVTLRHLVTVG